MAHDLVTFDIRISEGHRQYLLTAVQNMIDQNYLGADPVDREAIKMLFGMLDDLPVESARIGEDDVLHDFTL